MAMGSTKDLHGTDEDDDYVQTMPTLPERNHKKRTLQLFWFYDGADDLFSTNDQDLFYGSISRHVMYLHADGDNVITQLFFRCPPRH
jgi:hypothetical protein